MKVPPESKTSEGSVSALRELYDPFPGGIEVEPEYRSERPRTSPTMIN